MTLKGKQALILLIATVLPFTIGAAAMDLVVAPAYRAAVRSATVESAQRLADHVAWSAARNLDALQKVAAWNRIPALIRASSRSVTPALEQRWNDLPASHPAVKAVLENPVSWELWRWQATESGVLQAVLTDAQGRVVAASLRPRSYDLSGEAWWRAAHGGKVYVSDVRHDPAARAWTLQMAVPVLPPSAPPGGNPGVLMVTLDAIHVFRDLQHPRDSHSGEVALMEGRGQVLLSGGTTPDAFPALIPRLVLLKQNATGSATVPTRGDSAIVAWSKVPFESAFGLNVDDVPELYVVSSRSSSEAFGTLRAVQGWMLGISLVTICLAVALGYWLTDVLVTRPIRKLALGMRRLAQGDFGQAASIAEELTHPAEKRPPFRKRMPG